MAKPGDMKVEIEMKQDWRCPQCGKVEPSEDNTMSLIVGSIVAVAVVALGSAVFGGVCVLWLKSLGGF